MAQTDDRTLWHQGFYGGIELEFRQWRSSLSFLKEHELTKEPLVVDLLIIKKAPDVVINHPIGSFFRTWNVVEYKSPEDTLSLDAFYKSLGYASLYKAMGERENEIPLEELTLSVFCFHHPHKLFAQLAELGATIEVGKETGIYHIQGFPGLAVQVIVTRELPKGLYLPFRILQPKAEREDVAAFLSEAGQLAEPVDQQNLSALLRVSIAANRELYAMVRREQSMDVYAALREVFPELYEEGRTEGEAKGRAEGETSRNRAFITAMLQDNEPVSRIMRYTQAPVEQITEIARSLGIQPVS